MASVFVKKVNLFTYGDPKLLKKLIYPIKNINIINFSKNSEIQTKTRFINSNRGEKLLQVCNIDKNTFSNSKVSTIIKKLKKVKGNLVICDFGVGLFDNNLLNFINRSKIQKFINVQTNSVNYGFNLFTKYSSCFYLSLDSREWSLGLKTKELELTNIKKINVLNKGITKGQKGSIFISRDKIIKAPVFVKSVKDTTGSGDAFFVITSLLLMENAPNLLIPFLKSLCRNARTKFR